MGANTLLGGYNVQLERNAVSQLGSAVADFSGQASLGSLSGPLTSSVLNGGKPTITSAEGLASTLGVSSINGITNLLGITQNAGTWQSPQYAADLVKYAPKHRFIFKVQFIFNAPYSKINTEFTYVVKQVDKPKVTFEYEDVNMYNFRTKVLKSIRHDPLSMTFHDDIQNKVLDFFNSYRTAHSPISAMMPDEASRFEHSGMSFQQPNSLDGGKSFSASMGILANGNKNILSQVKLIQIYAHGTRQNVYTFVNPRIDNFDFDNLDHESSEGNAMSVSFNYDSLFITDDPTSGTPSPRWGMKDILGNNEHGARQPFGNTMGGDSGFGSSTGFPNPGLLGDVGGLSGSYGVPGLGAGSSLNSMNSFPKLNVSNIVSSASNAASSSKNTLLKIVPGVNNGTAGMDTGYFDP